MCGKDTVPPSYGNLGNDDKKKVNEELEKYISTKETLIQKVVKPVPKATTQTLVQPVIKVRSSVSSPVVEKEYSLKRKERVEDSTVYGCCFWNPTKAQSFDMVSFLRWCRQVIRDSEIDLEEVYSIIHENDYDFEQCKKEVLDAVERIQKQRLTESDIRKIHQALEQTKNLNELTELTGKKYHQIVDFVKTKRDNLAVGQQ